MKKVQNYIAFLFAILFFQSTYSFSQINTYFQNNPVWQNTSSCGQFYPCVDQETYNYYVNGDTLFNGLTYKKIFRKGTGEHMWFAPPPALCSGTYSFIDTFPSYFMRSFGKQMFIRTPFDTSEYLLYDFNLIIGDTLPISYNNYESNVTVIAIDSIYTPYGYRQRFEITGNTWSQYLIEGIGHSKGLVETMQTPLECGFELVCFSLNDTSYYPTAGPTCNMNVGLSELEDDIPPSVFPNPFTQTATITLGKQVNNATLFISNSLGQVVRKYTNLNGTTISIDSVGLPGGFYTCRILSDGNYSSIGRMIIIKE